MILDGKKIAWGIYDNLSKEIKKLETIPTLGAVLVGDNPVSMRYISQKKRFAEQIGMNFKLFQFPENISERDLLSEIQKLNQSPDVSWYIVQLPLPDHIDSLSIINAITPSKDVDGFHPENQWKIMIWDTRGFVPCTPAGVIKICSYYDISLKWKQVVVIWRSNIVGKPLVNLLISTGATVINCNSKTPDISLYTKTADIVISAVGKPGLISPDIVKEDAVIIDVGFSIIDGKIYGDCDYDDLIAQWNSITPVPGWVGPMTVAMLLQNTYQAHIQNPWIKKS